MAKHPALKAFGGRQSNGFLNRRSQVRLLPRALFSKILNLLGRLRALLRGGEPLTASAYVLTAHVPARGVWVAQWWVYGEDGRRFTGQRQAGGEPAARMLASLAAESAAVRLGYQCPEVVHRRAPADVRLWAREVARG